MRKYDRSASVSNSGLGEPLSSIFLRIFEIVGELGVHVDISFLPHFLFRPAQLFLNAAFISATDVARVPMAATA